jgi:hypothetical protein
VNALVRDFLTRYVDDRSQRLEVLASFEAVAAASQGISPQLWIRESLYEFT